MSIFSSKKKCPSCLKENKSANQFCNYCGNRLNANDGVPEIKDNKWLSKIDEFAAVINIDDLDGFFSKNIIIEPGTRALLIKNNRFAGERKPGNYTVETFLGNLFRLGAGKDISVVITKHNDVPLQIKANNIMTKDFLEISISCELSIKIGNIEKFILNLMGNNKLFLVNDLKRLLFPFVLQSLKETIKLFSIEELANDISIRSKIDENLVRLFDDSLSHYGLLFNSIRTIDFTHEAFDEFQKSKGQCWLQVEKKKLESDNRKSLFEVYSDNDLQSIKEFERKNELDNLKKHIDVDKEEAEHNIHIRRIELQSEIRKAMNSDKFDEIKNERDLADFLHKIDKDKLLKQEEKDILIEEYKARKDDRDSARKFLLDKLRLQRNEEIDLLRLISENKVQSKRFELESDLAKKVANEENKKRIEQLEQLKKEKEYQYEEDYKTLIERTKLSDIARKEKVKNRETDAQVSDIDRTENLKDAQVKSKISELEREQDKKDSEMAFENLRRIKELKEQKQQKDHERELEKIKIQQTEKIEIAKLNAMKGMSAEELIALTSGDADKIVQIQKVKAEADLARTKEITDRERELYKELLKEKDVSRNVLQQTTEKTSELLSNLAGKQADALASNFQGAISGGRNFNNYSNQMKVVKCSKCRADNPADARNCSNCGEKI